MAFANDLLLWPDIHKCATIVPEHAESYIHTLSLLAPAYPDSIHGSFGIQLNSEVRTRLAAPFTHNLYTLIDI
jgi:hypothetical protein